MTVSRSRPSTIRPFGCGTPKKIDTSRARHGAATCALARPANTSFRSDGGRGEDASGGWCGRRRHDPPAGATAVLDRQLVTHDQLKEFAALQDEKHRQHDDMYRGHDATDSWHQRALDPKKNTRTWRR